MCYGFIYFAHAALIFKKGMLNQPFKRTCIKNAIFAQQCLSLSLYPRGRRSYRTVDKKVKFNKMTRSEREKLLKWILFQLHFIKHSVFMSWMN